MHQVVRLARYVPRVGVWVTLFSLALVAFATASLLPCPAEARCDHGGAAVLFAGSAYEGFVPSIPDLPEPFPCLMCHATISPMVDATGFIPMMVLVALSLVLPLPWHLSLFGPPNTPPPRVACGLSRMSYGRA